MSPWWCPRRTAKPSRPGSPGFGSRTGQNRRLEFELGAGFEGACRFALVLALSQMREHGLGPFGRADLHLKRNQSGKAPDRHLVRLTLRGALLGLEIGTSQSTLPVGVGRSGRTPHIALSGAFLALRASDCNGWPRRWVSERRRDWDPGRGRRERLPRRP